jgi:hypothetical protein
MFTGISPMTPNGPSSLNALSRYAYEGTAIDVDLMDTMHLARNPTDSGWYGETGETGYHLTLEIPDAAWPAPHLLTLTLYDDATPIDLHTFQYLRIADTPRWDTDYLIKIWTPNKHFAFLRVMG